MSKYFIHNLLRYFLVVWFIWASPSLFVVRIVSCSSWLLSLILAFIVMLNIQQVETPTRQRWSQWRSCGKNIWNIFCISCPKIEVNRYADWWFLSLSGHGIKLSRVAAGWGGWWRLDTTMAGGEVQLVEWYDLGLGPLLRPRSGHRQLIMLGYSPHSSVQRIQTHWQ